VITCRVYREGSLREEKPFEARTIDEARAREWL
jgi:hypothetical protein